MSVVCGVLEGGGVGGVGGVKGDGGDGGGGCVGGIAEDAAGEDEHKHVFGSTTD